MNMDPQLKPDMGLVDQDFVAQLIEAIGVDDYCALIGSLTQDVEAQVLSLDALADAPDPQAMKQTAHRLAGLLSQFGAFEVARVAERMFEAGSSDEVGHLAATMSKLCRASMAAIAEIKVV